MDTQKGLIDGDTSRRYTIVKVAEMCPEAREALREAFYSDGEEIAEGIRSGRMELFHVNENSWAVTEIIKPSLLFIWCYAGRGSIQFVDRMRTVARCNGLTQVSFFSRHRAAGRLWRQFNPRKLPTQIPGEVQYVFEIHA